jgi:thermostable 8-oxoguanine DNA glycosylase
MITAVQLIPHKTSCDDYTLTEQLKAYFAQMKQERHPMYLTLDEFDRVLQWKLRGQYGRQRERRKANTDDVIRVVTGAALSIEHPDKDYEIDLRFGILCTLRGVGVPVASAILALVFPERYAVIDFRGWRQVFGEERTTFSVSDYRRYLRKVQNLAQELGWPVQEVDLAIWEYDRINGRKAVVTTAAG